MANVDVGGEIINLTTNKALLDDKNFRGGMRVVADIAARDALAGTDFDKVGMLVAVQADGKLYTRTVGGWQEFVGGGAGGGGWIYVSDLLPQTTETISDKVWQDAGNTVLQSATTDQATVKVEVRASFPEVDVNGTLGSLTRDVSGGFYSGTVDITLAGAGGGDTILATVTTPDGDAGATDSMVATVDAPPELLTLSFTGGYPGSQTELKAGDTFQVTGTTDKNADAIEIADFEASDAVQLLAFAEGTSFTVSMVVGDRGDVAQLQSINVRARASSGAFGSVRNSNVGGGGVDGTDVINLNNIAPSFVDNGTTFPGGQTAFKATEAGSQDTTVNDFDSVVYSDPTGVDFTIGSPSTYVQNKPITCANPGTYNDSSTNFRIVATRNANDSSATFNKTIEVADVAPVLTITQPAARLRSGGADGTAVQAHVITATSDQNLSVAPDVGVGVVGGGTFQGGGFVGGAKVWTRTLNVDDADAKGSGAWVLNSGFTNNAGIAGTIAGTQTNGGFVARTLTFGPFATTTAMNVEVVDFSKLTAGIFTSTNQTALKQPIGTPPSVTNGYTIDSLGINPTDVIWLDTAAAGANSGGTAQITNVEETV